MCRNNCCNESTLELHSCPYQSDVNGNDEDYCDCCKDCEYDCVQEI